MHDSDAERLLDNAEAHLEMHPDSAFVELDSLDRSQLNTPAIRARHARCTPSLWKNAESA